MERDCLAHAHKQCERSLFRNNPENFHTCITEIDRVEYFQNWTRDFQDMYYEQTQDVVNRH